MFTQFQNSGHNYSIDEDFANNLMKYFDQEIKEISEFELQLSDIKNIDQLKIPFSSNNTQNDQKTLSKPKNQNVLVKKKYQILNSVTIDLITKTATVERSTSKKSAK